MCLSEAVSPGDKNISRCTCPAGRVINNFHLSCKHMYLSFKSLCNKEHMGVIYNLSYKVPYITVKIIFTQSNSELHPIYWQKDFMVNTQKMLVSPLDFREKLKRTSKSSQSTRPTGPVLWKELLFLSRFTGNYKRTSGIFVPCDQMNMAMDESFQNRDADFP